MKTKTADPLTMNGWTDCANGRLVQRSNSELIDLPRVTLAMLLLWDMASPNCVLTLGRATEFIWPMMA